MFRSLRHRNFRLYFLGQLVSLHGTWMQHVAQSWLVYRLTDSSFMLGLTGFVGLLPILLFGLIGGVIADRLPRRRLLVGVQVAAMLQAALLALLTLLGWIQVWHILLLAALLGITRAFEMPARHALIAQMVERGDLLNAIALNASVFKIARFAGPALAGWLVAWVGEGMVFLVNALSFFAALAALCAMRLNESARAVPRSRRKDLVEGVEYAWKARPIRLALGMVALLSVAGMSNSVLMPVFAREVFNAGPETLGLLLGALGVGALLGTLRLAQRSEVMGLDRLIGWAGVTTGLTLPLFAQAGDLIPALLALVVVGFSMTSVITSANTFIQLTVSDAVRGRVMALFSVLLMGLMSVGDLLAGTLGEWLGASTTVTGLGLTCLLGALVYLRSMGKGKRGELRLEE